jgi:hypothetical protein
MWAKYRILGDYPSCFLEEKGFLSGFAEEGVSALSVRLLRPR